MYAIELHRIMVDAFHYLVPVSSAFYAIGLHRILAKGCLQENVSGSRPFYAVALHHSMATGHFIVPSWPEVIFTCLVLGLFPDSSFAFS